METSDDLVETPLCDPPSTQKNKIKFFSPQNVLGRNHYRLRMDETGEYLPMPPSLGSVTRVSLKVNQYTVLTQTVAHGGFDVTGGQLQLHSQNCLFDIITKYMGQRKTMHEGNNIK